MYRIRDTKPEKVYKKQRAYVGPFPYECLENIHILGLDFKTGFLSRCTAIENTSLAENLAMFLLFPSDLFFQFHGMMQKIATYDHDRPEDSPQIISTSPQDRKEFYSELKTYLEKVDQQNQPPESKNGANTNFEWENRKTIEQLQAGEPIYEALKKLKAEAEKRGVNFVLYSTPTVKHTDAPFVYPKGYHENYQKAMRNMAKELNIPYYDYSFFLPWEGEVMYDFIHAKYPIRQDLHKHLLYQLMDDGVLK